MTDIEQYKVSEKLYAKYRATECENRRPVYIISDNLHVFRIAMTEYSERYGKVFRSANYTFKVHPDSQTVIIYDSGEGVPIYNECTNDKIPELSITTYMLPVNLVKTGDFMPRSYGYDDEIIDIHTSHTIYAFHRIDTINYTENTVFINSVAHDINDTIHIYRITKIGG